ncbi:MAG TPA: LytTR family DNA-binding domain-containing protein, partial [Chitinophagaceae bacterium]|nr:LytTR family DNA-binding domain-containing protein [Chitinophagaceae bacterium]
ITATFIKKNFPDLFIVGEAGSVAEGLTKIGEQRPDLVLLDIEMPDGTGFDLLRRVEEKNFEVIFITAFNAYAIDAFRFSAIDYLLKPVSLVDLKEALLKVKEKIQGRLFEKQWASLSYNLEHKNNYDRRLAITTSSGFVFADVKDIVRCESSSNYTQFYFANDKKMLSSRNLGYYEELLPPEKFCRIHHSHLINIDFLDRYIKGGSGGSVIMKDGTELDVSQRKKEQFLQKVLAGR